jgi:hypothetical protein
MRIEFTLDCADLKRMGTLWQSAAEFTVDSVIPGRYVSLRGHDVVLTLQPVAEPKSGKNRMHLDLLVGDIEAEVRRLEALGCVSSNGDCAARVWSDVVPTRGPGG